MHSKGNHKENKKITHRMGENISKQSNQQGINLQNIQRALHSRVLSHFSHVQLFVTLWTVACQAPLPWDSPGRNIGVGGHALLQGIFPTQGLNPGLLYCRWIVYQLSHQGSPGIPKWVVYPFSRESSQPRNQTKVSCIAGRFFTS